MEEFEVIVDKWGNYKKGDKLKLPMSTGMGCVANKVLKKVTNNKKGKE